MTHSAGTEINIVICDNDLLAGIIQLCKNSELSFIGLLFSHRVSDLDIVLLIAFIGYKIYFLRAVMIYLEAVAHIKEFVINDVLKIVGEIISAVHNADGIQSDILIVNLEIIFQFAFGFDRILLYSLYCIGFFQIADILGDRCDGAGQASSFHIFLHGSGGEDSAVRQENKVGQPFEDLGFPDLITVNDIVQNNGFIQLIQINSLAALAAVFDSLWKAAPDNIIGKPSL